MINEADPVPHHSAWVTEGCFATEAARRAALARRDKAADGHFVYSVRTTGVYCRPSCAARPARPDHVGFHASPEAARAAGFRACLRCRPDQAPSSLPGNAAVTAAARMIERAVAMEKPAPSLDDLAGHAGFSASHFHRMFRKALGITPKAYANQVRSRRASEALSAASSVTDAMLAAGYSSSSRFYEHATARIGMAPSRRLSGGAGERITVAIAGCSLGRVMVAATAKGICLIAFGDSDDALTAAAAARFPQASITPAGPDFGVMLADVVAMIETPGAVSALPLDVRGTAFQERVWQALQAIPPGETASYADIARAIGAPKACRAVAQACGSNPVAVAIPCHRVVAGDGRLSGYRWGPDRKAELLRREGAR